MTLRFLSYCFVLMCTRELLCERESLLPASVSHSVADFTTVFWIFPRRWQDTLNTAAIGYCWNLCYSLEFWLVHGTVVTTNRKMLQSFGWYTTTYRGYCTQDAVSQQQICTVHQTQGEMDVRVLEPWKLQFTAPLPHCCRLPNQFFCPENTS